MRAAVAVCAALATASALAVSCAPGPRAPSTGQPTALTVDARHMMRASVDPRLFGVGVDLSAATYTGPGCGALAGMERAVALVRIGAAEADDYDWRADAYDNPHNPSQHSQDASAGCPPPAVTGAASVLRVLDRARAIRAQAVVVLNGETDDPGAAYALVRVIAARYGAAFARGVYWEIGNAPAQWQHFGVPLMARSAGEHINCSPDQYAALVTGYDAAITAALDSAPGDANRPRIVADAWITNATDQSWAGIVAAVDTRYYPYTSLGAVPAGASAVAGSVSSPPSGTIPLDDQLGSLRASLAQYSGGDNVGLFIGQWDINSAGSATYGATAQAVFMAGLLVRAIHDGVGMAAWAPPLLYGYSSPSGQPQTPFVDQQPAPSLRVLTALRALAGAHVLTTPALPGSNVDTLAVRRADGGVSIMLVRPGGRGAVDVPLRLMGGPARPVRASLQTFSDRSDGAAHPFSVDPAGARITVPDPGVVILTLPAW